MPAGLLAIVSLVASAGFVVAGEATCDVDDASCTTEVDDTSSLLMTRVQEGREEWGPYRPKKEVCISSPSEWFDALNASEAPCVSGNLFGLLGSGQSLFPDHPLAFASGNTNLQNFLLINKAFMKAAEAGKLPMEDAKARVVAAFNVIVGFPKFAIVPKTKADEVRQVFTVYELPPGGSAVVPSWEQLFFLLEGFGLNKGKAIFPFEVQKEITLAYASGKDPIEAFTEVSGCPTKKVKKFLDGGITETQLLKLCNPKFSRVVKTLDGTVGVECFRKFKDLLDNKAVTATKYSARALFFKCTDASALFSGIGFGFNNLASPLSKGKTTSSGHYTGREFVNPNFALSALNEDTQQLNKIPFKLEKGFDFLEKGFWFDVKAPWWPF